MRYATNSKAKPGCFQNITSIPLSLSLLLIFIFNSNLRHNSKTKKKGDQNSVSESTKLQFRQPASQPATYTNFVIFTAISLVEVGRVEGESYNFPTAKLSQDNYYYYNKEGSTVQSELQILLFIGTLIIKFSFIKVSYEIHISFAADTHKINNSTSVLVCLWV